MSTVDTMFHYCEGTWKLGFVLDCKRVEEHKVKLQQTKLELERARFRLGTYQRNL